MHKRRKQAAPKPPSAAALVHNLAARPPGLVNNAAGCQKVSGSFASGSARSGCPRSMRASPRLPAESAAAVQKSERTSSREDPVSGRLRTKAQADAAPPASRSPHRKVPMPAPSSPFAHFVGFDWAKQHHHAVILDPAGQIVAEFGFEHTQAGWQHWRQQAARFAPLAVAVETSQGTVIDQLLQTPDCTIYPLNPKAAQRYRERKAPSGTKSDHLDAWSFADALRLDGSTWKPLPVQDPRLERLILLCR